MFKLVVLYASLAVASAKPSILIGSPVVYTSAVISPAVTTIARQASRVVHPSPVIYSTPTYAHVIKKRSVPVGYVVPATYSAPLITSTYAAHAPLWNPASVTYHYTPAHYIKKRSAPFALTSSYYAPTTYAATPLLPTSYYTAPTSISHQSRIDLHSSPVIRTTYASPYIYSNHLGISHVL